MGRASRPNTGMAAGTPTTMPGRQIGQRPPPVRCEERVAGGGADLAARARSARDRRACGRRRRTRWGRTVRSSPPARRQDRHPAAGEPRPIQVGDGAQLARGGIDDGCVPGDALAHRRAGADNHQVAGLEAGQQLVEVDVARGHPGDGVSPAVELLQPIEVEAQQVLDLGRGVGHPPLVDVVDHRLGAIERLGDVLGHRSSRSRRSRRRCR